jgi:Flp pilus assembly protein TadD
MDQFSAHLDRGWDLIQRGDTQGAEQSARRALELDGDSPEAYNLLGYAAALQGDFDDAVENYQQAIALDDTYLEAILNAAEVFIHPLADFDEAERLCDDALSLAETEDERVDALLLKFDALLGKNEVAAARELCGRFPRGPFENPAHAFLVGRALYEIGDAAGATPLITEAVRVNPSSPEAHYYMGLIHDEAGAIAPAIEAFLTSRELDLENPAPAWALSRETFRETVRQAVSELPEELRAALRSDQIYVADVPGVEVVVEGIDPRALLLLDAVTDADAADDEPDADSEDGAPNSSRSTSPPMARVFVYQRNVERVAGTVDAIIQELKAALTRELQSAQDPSATVE